MQDWSFKQKAVVLLVLGVVCLGYFHTRIYNGLTGPSDIEVSKLAGMEQVPAKEYVRVVRDGHPVDYTKLARAAFIEVQVRDEGDRHSASFRYLDEGTHRLLVRVADTPNSSDHELIGVLTSIKDTQLATEAPGEVLYVDCENTNYRLVSLLALGLGLMAIGLGLDQLRRAYRKPAA